MWNFFYVILHLQIGFNVKEKQFDGSALFPVQITKGLVSPQNEKRIPKPMCFLAHFQADHVFRDKLAFYEQWSINSTHSIDSLYFLICFFSRFLMMRLCISLSFFLFLCYFLTPFVFPTFIVFLLLLPLFLFSFLLYFSDFFFLSFFCLFFYWFSLSWFLVFVFFVSFHVNFFISFNVFFFFLILFCFFISSSLISLNSGNSMGGNTFKDCLRTQAK